jgi:glycosyltransferase involved in cell wall biosynthesis
MKVSVVLCTHNPRWDYLQRVVDGLKRQTLKVPGWELIVVDSACYRRVESCSEVTFPSGVCHVRVEQPGLALARLAGFEKAGAPLVATLDDDTVLDPDYLEESVGFFDSHPQVGAISGRIRAEYENTPPPWITEFGKLLALRDLGDTVLVYPESGEDRLSEFPDCAPIGVNVSRRKAIEGYIERFRQDKTHEELGRRGQSLDSGEDNDFALCVIKDGWSVAYVPELHLTHLIPARRMEKSYLGRLNHASSRTWIKVLMMHGICPWPSIPPWTVPLRKLKAWVAYRAWAGPAEHVRWRGACGHFEGRAGIKN